MVDSPLEAVEELFHIMKTLDLSDTSGEDREIEYADRGGLLLVRH